VIDFSHCHQEEHPVTQVTLLDQSWIICKMAVRTTPI